jgi:plasmid maintenance system antidote protein VapI
MKPLTKDLLLQLRKWCEQERGRKSLVARYLDIDSQALSNLFGDRQQLTGEQALAIQEFLKKQRRSKKT